MAARPLLAVPCARGGMLGHRKCLREAATKGAMTDGWSGVGSKDVLGVAGHSGEALTRGAIVCRT